MGRPGQLHRAPLRLGRSRARHRGGDRRRGLGRLVDLDPPHNTSICVPRNGREDSIPVLAWSHPGCCPDLLPSLIVFGWLPAGRCVAASPIIIALLTQAGLLLLLVGFTQAAYPGSAWPWVFGAFSRRVLIVRESPGNTPTGRSPSSSCPRLAVWPSLSARVDGARCPLQLCGVRPPSRKTRARPRLVLGVGSAFALVCSLCHGRGRRAACAGIESIVWACAPASFRWPSGAVRPTPSSLMARDDPRSLLRHRPVRSDPPIPSGRSSPNHPGDGCGGAAGSPGFAGLLDAGAANCGCSGGSHNASVIYLLIFQLTPENLTWHLGSALPRLLFHVGPMPFWPQRGRSWRPRNRLCQSTKLLTERLE